MPKTSAARLGKRAWNCIKRAGNFIGQIDTLNHLVGWIGGSCLGSILASRVMNPANIFVPLSWFFGTILVIVSTVKLLNLLWSKRDQFPWIKRHGDSAAQLELERRLLGTAESDAAFLALARERDALSKELQACKVKFSHAKLHWIAERQVLSGDEDAIVDVVVRFAGSSDYFIANNIKKIIEGHAGWRVTLNGSNDPPIEPNNEFKVLFESDLRNTFYEICEAFKYGNLLNDHSVQLNCRHLVLEDRRHLVVVVTPTVMQ